MSQVPPPPPPYGSSQPSYGGGPYAAPGAPVSYGTQRPAPKQNNGPAIASLVFGILGCIPFVTGLLAIVLGAVGLRKARDPYVGGKGLAIAGLLLGVLSVTLWALLGRGAYNLYAHGKPARDLANAFARDLSAGNVDAALARCTPAIKRADLVTVSDKLKAAGPLQDTTMPVFTTNTAGGATTAEVAGVARFGGNNVQPPYFLRLVKEGGTFKIDGFSIEGYGSAGAETSFAQNRAGRPPATGPAATDEVDADAAPDPAAPGAEAAEPEKAAPDAGLGEPPPADATPTDDAGSNSTQVDAPK